METRKNSMHGSTGYNFSARKHRVSESSCTITFLKRKREGRGNYGPSSASLRGGCGCVEGQVLS
eukprot:1188252-Amphidinium_carterae.2